MWFYKRRTQWGIQFTLVVLLYELFCAKIILRATIISVSSGRFSLSLVFGKVIYFSLKNTTRTVVRAVLLA